MPKKIRRKRINYYLEKYGQKMRGGPFSTARGWVRGIGTLSKKEKEELLIKIKDKYYR